jgi:hypothetical protein
MANCCDMEAGDLFVCEVCGLELSVKKACACAPDASGQMHGPAAMPRPGDEEEVIVVKSSSYPKL